MPSAIDRPALVWFRDDLRLADNPALDAAQASGRRLVLVFLLDDVSAGVRPLGGAARWWLSRSLAALSAEVEAKGGQLVLRRGAAGDVLPRLAHEAGAGAVYWNRRYGAPEIATDRAVKASLVARGIKVESFGGSLLHEPWTVATQSGAPFRVFTPFYRRAAGQAVRSPTRAPSAWRHAPAPESERLEDWALEPTGPDWAGGLRQAWTPGEEGARAALADFIDGGLDGYAGARDRPDQPSTSRLSPHLRFGEMSPHRAFAAVRHAEAAGDASARDIEKFVSEVYWREFSYHLLFHFPDLAQANFSPRFDAFEWANDTVLERAWRSGRTGYPLVDAGMRQLWQTGWMHNRVRMVAASFLIKHGLTDWRRGEDWFWDTLVDADPANNPASWQWVAGSGADAAPYFRVFNPVAQGEKFDPEGTYVRHFVPELAGLPAKLIHRPWEAPADLLRHAGVVLGETYPRPIVDHAQARQRALDRFQRIRGD
ncbi:deoxyribodipyrimidine photo-lyase [Ancylobacter dichloromethanicus]|uniref:Deoxyribodipyrimidine photo-lyase n=1 Tax=Ancylobacter dichloromethanicus TaxID=518825 RepID=A0A9W6JAV7_9HYPH|nr:deoxyribodipyrimidine photo-lyase [Ancylobacter dichloromethanicus]MBS7554770.1 deoxyribodipyrimidine photo-lyase [Ancylobacter dichloromethanicus]GLK72455.1 deoxyribodipyrimidine photo-lyase [Ancylobacter dichloromethanicus]